MERQDELIGTNPVFSSLKVSRRRDIIQLLQERTSAIGLRELATNLAATEQEKPLMDLTQDDVQPIYTDLIHHQLPHLEEAGLVEWSLEQESVTTTNHPALSDPKLQQILEIEADDWDDIVASLAHKCRRIILSILKDTEGTIARDELAKKVVARQHDDLPRIQLREAADELVIDLHHVHLPQLQEAGLITYDHEDGTVSYEGH